MHTVSNLITSLASMIQLCTCTCKRETDREEERKNDEEKERKGGKKKKKYDNSSLVVRDTVQSGRNMVICRRLCS
jgi:hypothetical protein